jgi:hypothetical protein
LHTKTARGGDPFLISRNLNETALIDWDGNENMELQNIGHRGTQNQHIKPFDDRALAVTRMDGSAEILQLSKKLRWHVLNPNAITNRILAP